MEIRSEEEYRHALAEIDRLEPAREGTPEFERRMQLLAMAEQYEQSCRNTGTYRGKPLPE